MHCIYNNCKIDNKLMFNTTNFYNAQVIIFFFIRFFKDALNVAAFLIYTFNLLVAYKALVCIFSFISRNSFVFI